MMEPDRKRLVLDWMVDAYIEGVDAWAGHMDVRYDPKGPDNLHGPLSSFNALGQSIPIIEPILDRLAQLNTVGRAQWWLVLVTGLTYPSNECPWIPPWTPEGGGGGVYLRMSDTAICNHGFLPENLRPMREVIEPGRLRGLIEASELLLGVEEAKWASDVWARIDADPSRFAMRTKRYLSLLAEPDLGGVVFDVDPLGEI